MSDEPHFDEGTPRLARFEIGGQTGPWAIQIDPAEFLKRYPQREDREAQYAWWYQSKANHAAVLAMRTYCGDLPPGWVSRTYLFDSQALPSRQVFGSCYDGPITIDDSTD